MDGRFANREKTLYHGLVVDHELLVSTAQTAHDKHVGGRFRTRWIEPRGEGRQALADLVKDVVVVEDAQVGFHGWNGQGE